MTILYVGDDNNEEDDDEADMEQRVIVDQHRQLAETRAVGGSTSLGI